MRRLLVLLLISTAAVAATNESELQEIKEADFILESGDGSMTVSSEGKIFSTIRYKFKAQNEVGRVSLGHQSVTFLPDVEKVKVNEAYTLTNGLRTDVNLKNLTERSISPSNTGLLDIRELIIPFDNLKSNSTVYYSYSSEHKKPMLPGFAFFEYVYGAEFPELSGTVEILSAKPLKYSVLDSSKTVEVKEIKIGKQYKIAIKQVKPSYKANKLKQMSVIPSGFLPMVYVSTATSWDELAKELAKRYEPKVNEPLPPQFQKIASEAAKLSSDIEKLNYVIVETGKVVGYSGNWVTQDKMFFPRGHDQVVKEGKGDCKDYATSIAGILRNLGYNSDVALVTSSSPNSRVLRDVDIKNFAPTPSIFNHAIATVLLKDNRRLWLDGTKPVPYADGIFPDLAGSPALILSSTNAQIMNIPSEDNRNSKLVLTRKVKLDGSEHPQWEGVLKIEGGNAIRLILAEQMLGRAQFNKIVPRFALGTAESEQTKFISNENIINAKSGAIEIPFQLVGRNPVIESKDKDKTQKLRVTTGTELAALYEAEEQGGVNLGSKSINETTTTFENVVVDNEIDGDCFVLSKWVNLERVVEVKGKATIVKEVTRIKEPLISKADAESKEFDIMLSDLISCYKNSDMDIRKGDGKEKNKNLSEIRRAPIAKESQKIAEQTLDDVDEMDWHYGLTKAKRIFDVVLAADPKNRAARAYRAFAILRMGYMSNNEYEKAYSEFVKEELTQLVKDEPNYYLPHAFLFLAYRSEKNTEAAMREAIMAYNAEQNNFVTRLTMAKAHIELKKLEDAEKWLVSARHIAKTNNDHIAYWTVMGALAELKKDSQTNLKAHEELVKLQPESPWALHNYALQLGYLDDIDKAIELERKVLKIMDFGAANYTLAKLLSKKAIDMIPSGNTDKKYSKNRDIENMLLESYKRYPENEATLYYLARLYLARCDVEKESDWVDNADIYIREGRKRFPESESLQELETYTQGLKKNLIKYFRQRNINPTGRWPAEFK